MNTTHLNPAEAAEGEENQQYPSFTKFNILNYIYSATLLISLGLLIGLIASYVMWDTEDGGDYFHDDGYNNFHIGILLHRVDKTVPVPQPCWYP